MRSRWVTGWGSGAVSSSRAMEIDAVLKSLRGSASAIEAASAERPGEEIVSGTGNLRGNGRLIPKIVTQTLSRDVNFYVWKEFAISPHEG
jgi:hypothetical protein